MNKKNDPLPLDTVAWMADAELRCLDPVARGCLIDLMCYAHHGSPYGFVTTSGVPMNDQMLARLMQMDVRAWKETKAALIQHHRIDVAEGNGAIFIKRMVRDYERKMLATEGGHKGGNPDLVQPQLFKPEVEDEKAQRAKPITVAAYWNKLPSHLQVAAMRDAVSEWHDYRLRRKICLTKQSMARQVAQLTPLSPEQAVHWIHTAIDRNWRGLYPPPNGDSRPAQNQTTTRPATDHRATRASQEFPANANPIVE